MRAILERAIARPVLLNLMFWVVCAMGLVAVYEIPKEEFPQVTTDRVTVFTSWVGAGSAEIEDQLVRPLEDAIDGVEGLKHVYAESTADTALLTLEFGPGIDAQEARRQVARRVSELDLPQDATSVQVSVAGLRIALVKVALLGDLRQLDLVDRLSESLSQVSGVQEVRTQGGAEPELRVELDPTKLEAYGIQPQEVANALQRAQDGAPAGTTRISGQRVLVRTPGGARTAVEVERVPIRSRAGATLRVSDLGRVRVEWVVPEVQRRVSGQPAIVMTVFGEDDVDAIRAVSRLREKVDELAGTLPPGLELVAYDDSARTVGHRIDILMGNGLAGILLVCMVLTAFIGLRNTMLVIWGMPVALLGAMALMPWFGVSINVVSIFGMLLVTGIVVDDAIVIVENVQRHLEKGKSRVQATLDGVAQVAGAVFSATLTTCLAFAPLMMLTGGVGTVMTIVPKVVILSLIASLFEAFIILPGHLAHHAREVRRGDNRLTATLKRWYEPLVRYATAPQRRLVALFSIFLLVGCLLGLAGFMRLSLNSTGNPTFVIAQVDLPPTAHPDETLEVVRKLERAAAEVGGHDVLYMEGRVGEQRAPRDYPVWGDRFGQVKIGFRNEPDVHDRVPNILAAVRATAQDDPRVQRFGFKQNEGGPPTGRAIDVRVRGRDEAEVAEIATWLEEFLRARDGVVDLRSEVSGAEDTYIVKADTAAAAAFGLRQREISGAVRAAHDGLLGGELQVGQRTSDMLVSTTGGVAGGMASVFDTPVGGARLRQIAEVERRREPGRTQRVDGMRAIRVSAEVDERVTTAENEAAALEAAYAAEWSESDVSLFYGGRIQDARDSFSQLPGALSIALLLIYTVLAVQFRNYLQPFIILSAVPLGMAGAIGGLFLLGMDLSFIAMIGSVGLAGIVVNDSLVLVEFINLARADGRTARQAVIDASIARLRPILITTATTVLGLLPLALGIAGAEPLLAPMAVAITFGLTVATTLTLVLVPVLYLALDDLGQFLSSLGGKPKHGSEPGGEHV